MKQKWILPIGVVWLAAGLMLLYRGLHYLFLFALETKMDPLAATFLVALPLSVGTLKGRFVLSRTMRRLVERLEKMEGPIGLSNAYPRWLYLVMGAMSCMGFFAKMLPLFWRGEIDAAVGAALVVGGIRGVFFATTYGRENPAQSPERGRSVRQEEGGRVDGEK
jgi:hypothetical protein